MKILHYTLGFAPQRSGGLVRYATDLMQAQVASGHEVLALYPGRVSYISKATRIVKGQAKNCPTYEIVNSLPLAISGGIADVAPFMKSVNPEIYEAFLKEHQPDILHMHTLMGLHRECLQVARKLGIKVVFTSHDYYGLAPVPSFYYNQVSYDRQNDNHAWQVMSSEAMSVKTLRLFQWPIYPLLRRLVHWFRPQNGEQQVVGTPTSLNYQPLRDYYQAMFAYINGFHFNSELAQSVYRENLQEPIKVARVLSITHAQIQPQMTTRFPLTFKRLGFIGPSQSYKGLDVFWDLSLRLGNEDYAYHTWGHVPTGCAPQQVVEHGKFDAKDIDKVYAQIDVLIVPSRWKETFGFIVLEALARGKVVLASSQVGAKDVLPADWIFEDLDDLCQKLAHLSVPDMLPVKNLAQHVSEISAFYYELREG